MRRGKWGRKEDEWLKEKQEGREGERKKKWEDEERKS